jgi:SPP1 family predicted phage head-tail adaptor
MRAGKLRHRVTLQRKTSTRDAAGQHIEPWTDLGTVRASIEPLSGIERLDGGAEYAESTVRVRMRHSSLTGSLTPADRLSYGGQVYDIQNVANLWERDRELVLMCSRAE